MQENITNQLFDKIGGTGFNDTINCTIGIENLIDFEFNITNKEIVSIHSDQIASYRQTAKEDPKDGDQNDAVQGDATNLDSNEDKQLVEPTKPAKLKE